MTTTKLDTLTSQHSPHAAPAAAAAASAAAQHAWCCVQPADSKAEMTTPATSVFALQTSFFQSGLLLLRADPRLFFSAVNALNQEAFSRPPQPQQQMAPPPQKRACCTTTAAAAAAAAAPPAAEEPSAPPQQQQPQCKQKLYALPSESQRLEYYLCTRCSERRPENTFKGDPEHAGHEVKWFCPLCGGLFSVTYRSQHLCKKHGLSRRQQQQHQQQQPSPSPSPTVAQSPDAVLQPLVPPLDTFPFALQPQLFGEDAGGGDGCLLGSSSGSVTVFDFGQEEEEVFC